MTGYPNRYVFWGIGLLLVIGVAISGTIAKAENLSLTVNAGDYRIIDDTKGQMVEMEGFDNLMEPGKPILPVKNYLIALPPGAKVKSVEVSGINASQLMGIYRIIPAPPILPLIDTHQYPEYIGKIQREWQRNKEAVYSSDQAYPNIRGKYKCSGTLRKYSYVSVSFYPFSYHPQSGRLIFYEAAYITIDYNLLSPGSMEAQKVEELKWDNLADERASRLFVNYQQMKDLYQPEGVKPSDCLDTYDYVIITTGALRNAVTTSDFISWKNSLNYNVNIVLTTDPEITGQQGNDLAGQIRNFLRDYYGTWGIEYVLIVGDYETVPMRYCYPDSTNHENGAGNPAAWPWSGDVPTDYYYADLSYADAASWDSDRDGFMGEYGQDSPDFLAEVYVGRIPTNNISRITYALNKLVTFEQDTGYWKDQVLHAGAIAYFENEDHSGRDLMDGAVLINQIETDLMSGLIISHYSEQEGLGPSAHTWPALTEGAFIADWRNNQYGLVNWYAHGWSSYVARKVWWWDDGDMVPETQNPNEMIWPNFISINSNLDDDYPSIVFALSCLVGYPEPNSWGNLGIDLLTRPSYGASAGVVSGTRVVWVSTGGGELHSYEFNHYMLDGPDGPEKVGNALYDSEFYLSHTYNWEHYAEYWDLFTFNLYGDPSLIREGTSGGPTSCDEIDIGLPGKCSLMSAYPNPFNAATTIPFSLVKADYVNLKVYNLYGQLVETLVDDKIEAGSHTISWDASALSSGIYFYKLTAGDKVFTRRMTLLK